MAVFHEHEQLGWSDAVVDLTSGVSSGRVMVIDDEPADVTFVSRILRTAGLHKVSGFTDAHVALAAVRRWDPDLVVLDLHMLGLDGTAFLDALHASAATDDFLPVLVLTADDSSASMRSALAAGANDYATKPVDPNELLLRVRNLLSVRYCHENLKTHNAAMAAELRAHTRLDREIADVDRDTRDRVIEQLRSGGPDIVFQPIVDLRGGEHVGYESLARFPHDLPPRRPDVWFAEAATVGLGVELELCAIETALEQVRHLGRGRFISINLSPTTLVSDECHDLLAGFPSDRIVLEITEHQAIDDYVTLTTTINDLRERGARLAIDDAGAGFASLRHILKLSPDFIKLDIGLTRDIDTDPVKRALVPALVGFAAETGALIIAEGIETAEELATLRRLGVDYGQGFHIARPLSLKCALNGVDTWNMNGTQ
jgi:EAL domain-containing protein (putative c-di-GMP-specific phosphodiesterase class I)/AmiR/NasT family two-component response regulator